MRAAALAATAVLLATMLVPAAAGYAQPVLYFLKSGCPVEEVEGQCHMPEVPIPAPPTLPPLPVPVPIGGVPPVGQPKLVFADGVLDPYSFANPNLPNSTEPDVKLVYPGAETLLPVRFLTPDNHSHPDRIRGSFLVGLWIGEAAVPNGNLTTTLYEVKPDGSTVPLANASVAVDLNASKAPDPASLVPPNSTDPMAILLYEVAQVLPLVLQPPLLFLMGPVDYTIDNASRLALGFRLEQGSSALPEPPGAVTLRFNATLMPSFVYVPWYAPDPPKATYSSTWTGGGTRGTSTRGGYTPGAGRTATGTTALDGDDKDGNGIPGLAMPLILLLLAAVAFAVRRRI